MDEAQKITKVEGPREPRRPPIPMKERRGEKKKKKHSVEERKYSQEASDIEASKSSFGITRVPEDAGYEKTRQNEENINASPPPLPRSGKSGLNVMVLKD